MLFILKKENENWLKMKNEYGFNENMQWGVLRITYAKKPLNRETLLRGEHPEDWTKDVLFHGGLFGVSQHHLWAQI